MYPGTATGVASRCRILCTGTVHSANKKYCHANKGPTQKGYQQVQRYHTSQSASNFIMNKYKMYKTSLHKSPQCFAHHAKIKHDDDSFIHSFIPPSLPIFFLLMCVVGPRKDLAVVLL